MHPWTILRSTEQDRLKVGTMFTPVMRNRRYHGLEMDLLRENGNLDHRGPPNSSHFPIQRLPIEILSLIFTFVVQTNSFSFLADGDIVSSAATNLGLTCLHWRAVCLATPQIWARIYIEIWRDLDSISHALLHGVKLHLSRAHDVPLHITLALFRTGDRECARSAVTDLLRRNSHRWGYFSIVASGSSATRVASLLASKDRLPRLHELELDVSSLSRGTTRTFHNASNLRSLKLVSYRIHDRLDSSIPWSYVTHLHLSMSASAIWDSLQLFPRLHTAYFSLRPSPQHTDNCLPFLGHIVGDTIHTLTVEVYHLTRYHEPFALACNFLEGLTCPRLESLSLIYNEKSGVMWPGFRPDPHMNSEAQLRVAISKFLQRSSVNETLVQLALHHIPFSAEQVVALLQSLDYIRDLSIDEPEHKGYKRGPDFNRLLTGAFLGRLACTQSALVPRLRNLSLSACGDWEDHNFEDVLEARSIPPQPMQPLDSVLLKLKNLQHLDIQRLRALQLKGLALRVVEVKDEKSRCSHASPELSVALGHEIG